MERTPFCGVNGELSKPFWKFRMAAECLEELVFDVVEVCVSYGVSRSLRGNVVWFESLGTGTCGRRGPQL